MNVHGRLRALAALLCSQSTMARVIDPVLTDIEIEYRTALAARQRWRSRWIRVAGCFALLKVVALCAYDRTTHDWRPDDRRTLARAVRISAIAFVITALLQISPFARATEAHLLLYVIPQALPFAIPVALTWGILCGLGGRVVAFRVKSAILVLALACCAGSLATTVWIMPAANQAYRVAVFERLRPQGSTVTVAPGPAEMPMRELRKSIDELTASGQTGAARSSAFTYYVRWSLPFTPLALALFALALVARPFAHGWVLPGVAISTCLVFYVVLFGAGAATGGTELPVGLIVWLPNLVFVAASAALIVPAARPDPSSTS
jgi:lipopolysaccharide export LptBFGC system permease protein LptF